MAKRKFLSQIEKDFPARYSDALLPVLAGFLEGYERILDPMAGTGSIRLVRPDCELLELEPEWAAIRGATVGHATHIPWPDASFDAVVTSPTYGNRMADHHKAKDASRRNTYTHRLGRELNPNNTGRMQWGKTYRLQHFLIWEEVRRVLRPGGRFVLNVKDHIRKGKVVPVTRFHRLLLILMGFELISEVRIKTPGLRHGENNKARIDYESVLVFWLPKNKKFSDHWPSLEKVPEGIDRFSQYPIVGKGE